MINIDFLTIKAFKIENSDFFINSRVQKIQQPTRRDFIFFMRNNGETRKFYININPQIYHIAFISKENELKRNLKIPQKPPMFCMLLRKYLEGAKIFDITVPNNERILELHFEGYDELSNSRTLCLTIELMGKHSNVILYDKNTNIIIGCAHNIGAEKSRYRELQGGLKYIYPPKGAFKLSNELSEQFLNLSDDKINEYLNTETFRPAIKAGKYTLFSELIPDSSAQNSVNEMLDNYYSDFQQKFILKNEKIILQDAINSKLKKTLSAISKISLLRKKRNNTEKYKLFGELLTANIYKKEYDYKKTITLCDYNTGCDITIELDETKTLSENASRYYKLYSKSKITNEKSEKLLNDLYIKKEYYENILYSIESSDSLNDLEEISSEIFETKTEKNKKMSVIEKININGYEVYIGKNNKQNDIIVSKLAKDDDYWFHTRICAGSHVLLKTNGKDPEEDTIFECAKLARIYSSAKQPSKISVIYTKAKNLKKPPSSPLGYVTYKNEKEILI